MTDTVTDTASTFIFGKTLSKNANDSAASPASLLLKRANRHGFVAGATGTGKTVTLQTLSQTMALHGVPVFVVDVKGDLSGIALPKTPGLAVPPTVFWDVFGEQGAPLRTTVTEFGALLFSRLLGLSQAQAGVLDIAFKYADDHDLALIDLKDMTALLNEIAAQAKTISAEYGLVSPASIAAVQRELLRLTQSGGEHFFGEPALALNDLMRVNAHGYGTVNVLSADQLIRQPKLYATVLLWLLSELFEELPETGDPDKPKLCLFFDEAHLMFDDAPPVLIDKVEQAVRLIRSKGVGVYFVTQNPLDIPETILAQLGNRFQHALRAYTPKEQKAVRTASDTFRKNPAFDTSETITALGIGEALVSTLDAKGAPTMVEIVKIDLPPSTLGPITLAQRQALMTETPLTAKYTQSIDRESAYERLNERKKKRAEQAEQNAKTAPKPRGRARQSVSEALIKSVARSAGSRLGRQIGNEILRRVLAGFKIR